MHAASRLRLRIPAGLATLALLALLALLPATPAAAFQEAFLPIRMDSETGHIHLEITRLGEDFLYMDALAQGIGSLEPVRLDRGATGDARVVRFERRGPRVLLIQRNVGVVASSGDPGEVQAVEESFAPSVLASMPIVESVGERLVVDATDFLLSDVTDVLGSARRAGLGDLSLDRDRSFIAEEHTNAFPMNTEIRATLTFASENPHAVFRQHAPDGRSVTVQQHHSFLPLPDPPLAQRHYDPRTGNSAPTVQDYSQPFDGEYRLRSVARWRLVPSDPAAYLRGELTEPVTPIVIHLDPGIPEPYRSAYREGALWWNTAFEAAGFRDAFQVRDLPEGVHQMDARYSVLQAVHRTGPGPSTGNSFRHPGTGEMLQAITQMDSYRSLVDFNIYAGLLPAYDALGVTPQLTAEEFAMARRKQHTAHELGHAIGLPHNHSAAAQGRASVMDYPFPLIQLDDGVLDISEAYRDGIGYGDSLAIRYAYTWYPDAEAEREGLAAIAQEALDRGHRFITGGYARDLAGSQPDSHMWWEGDEPFEALERSVAVRRVILEHFDERAIRPGEPMAWLNHRLAHAYLHHRYQVEAVVKYIGGMWFTHALRGDGQTPREVIDAAEQRRALDRIVAVLAPEEIAVPERIVDLIPPIPEGYDELVPWIPSPGGPALDAQAIARSFSQEVVDNVLHPERVARVAAFHARDGAQLSLDELLGTLVDATWGRTRPAAVTERAYLRGTERAVLDGIFTLVADDDVTSEVKNAAERHLATLAEALAAAPGQDAEEQAQRDRARREIERYLTLGEVPALRTGVIELYLPWP
ncbi:MAG: zinc-dependent metalloprotease [Gemmatimonadota bacterium]